MKTPRWIVDAKGGPDQPSWEISVLRDSNEHGRLSYGWFGPDKLFVGSSGGPCRDRVTTFVWDRLLLIADELAKAKAALE